MMFPFLNSLIGFLIAYRSINQKMSENIFVNIYQLQILISSALILLFIQIFAADKMLSWILIGIFLISLSLFLNFSKIFHIEMVLKQIPLLLSEILIEMNMGFSFRKAAQAVFERQSEHSFVARFLFLKIKKHFFLRERECEKISCPYIQEFYGELIEIESSQHKIQEQILFMRNHYVTTIKFRHRSRQILLQPRLQAAVVTALYLCFAFMNGAQNNLKDSKVIFSISFILYVMGIYWLANLGRWKKWKV